MTIFNIRDKLAFFENAVAIWIRVIASSFSLDVAIVLYGDAKARSRE